MSGFFKVPNDVAEALLESDPDTFRLYCLIAFRAAYKRKPSGAGFMLEKGECDMTQKQMADALGVGRKKVRISITKLENLGVIEGQKRAKEGYTEGPKKGQRRNTLKLVDCWAGAGEGAKEGPKKGQEGAKEGPLKGTLSKKKTKTKTKNISPSADADCQPPDPAGHDDPDFLSFWAEYPKKQARGQAYTTFKKHRKRGVTAKMMIQAIKANVSGKLTNEDVKYIPHPSSWLNGEPWLDEASTPTKTGGRGRAASLGYDITDDSNYDVSDL